MVRAIQVYAADAEVTLPEDTYTITIGKTGTTVTPNKEANKTTAETALSVTAPDWAKTKLKSNKWDNGKKDNEKANVDSISAIIEVAQDGGTTVTYTPGTLADYINKTAAK